jgi:hypothetical protein
MALAEPIGCIPFRLANPRADIAIALLPRQNLWVYFCLANNNPTIASHEGWTSDR